MTGERLLHTDPSGWLVDETGLWVRTEEGVEVATDEERWLYDANHVRTSAPGQRVKPGLRDPGSGWYVEQHPTHFDWRADIAELAERIEDKFGVYCNTYYCHPPLWYLDSVSFDVWHMDGRGIPIGYEIGQAVFDYAFFDPSPPWIRWCIWWGWIWVDGVGWQVFEDDGTGDHTDHPHFTFHSGVFDG